MLEHNIDEDSIDRLGNIISILLPAKSYKILCAWTNEEALPAVEDFSCRLLILFGELSPSELGEYFGLSYRECEILIDSLLQKKLAIVNNDGNLTAAPLLNSKVRGDISETISLTNFEERTETVVFDLLTLGLLPSLKHNSASKYGLLEVSKGQHKEISINDVIQSFSSQFRAHLEYSRRSENEIKKTRLYKIMSCEKGMPLQIPIDIEVKLKPSEGFEPILTREVKGGSATRQYIISNELESCISDYIASLEVLNIGTSFSEYCDLVDDHVLKRYIENEQFNFSGWLKDRQHKKTGYGNQLTRGMLGPIYLEKNLKRIISEIKYIFTNNEIEALPPALWLSSKLPLWGANGTELYEFAKRMEKELTQKDEPGCITLLFNPQNEDKALHEKRYKNRIPNAISLQGESITDFIECFIIPDHLAVIQFHIYPSKTSSITVPIGFITTEKHRLEQIYQLVTSRIMSSSDIKVAWGGRNLSDLLPLSLLQELESRPLTTKRPHQQRKEVNVLRKRKFSFKKPESH
ncbi:hypothetical protein [Acinetobacter colistiniresistens]|uniref:hypothetical protein n=1 Tax=Acinetobacter colistiniresistens TaxID=280145 RepID=UPI000FDCB9A6|nr:hypothetical protein [Acinetobacter colistiniresistens]